MAKFRFRLATLQKLRAAHRDQMRIKLAEAFEAQQILAQRRVELEEEIRQVQQGQREALAGGGADMNQLLETQRYQTVLRAQQTALGEQSRMLGQEVEKRRQTLVAAERQVQILEKLQQRQKQRHRRKWLAAEVRSMDEIASGRCGGNLPWA